LEWIEVAKDRTNKNHKYCANRLKTNARKNPAVAGLFRFDAKSYFSVATSYVRS
jgi:hypothetical protein